MTLKFALVKYRLKEKYLRHVLLVNLEQSAKSEKINYVFSFLGVDMYGLNLSNHNLDLFSVPQK